MGTTCISVELTIRLNHFSYAAVFKCLTTPACFTALSGKVSEISPHFDSYILIYLSIYMYWFILFNFRFVLFLKSISLFSLMLSFSYFSIYVSTVKFKRFLRVRLEDLAKAPFWIVTWLLKIFCCELTRTDRLPVRLDQITVI